MGNDKTSWLDLDDDDDVNWDQPSANFTETIDPKAEPTNLMPTPVPQTPATGGYETRTIVEPGVEKTQMYLNEDAGFDEEADPVVGWLVVIAGPGLGRSLTLGAGMNTIGRDPDMQVPLDFGDKLISGSDHLRVLYDDESRAFYVAPGTGRNLSRLNKMPIAGTMPLPNNAVIHLSKVTKVAFAAFCGEDFDWSDLSKDGSES